MLDYQGYCNDQGVGLPRCWIIKVLDQGVGLSRCWIIKVLNYQGVGLKKFHCIIITTASVKRLKQEKNW